MPFGAPGHATKEGINMDYPIVLLWRVTKEGVPDPLAQTRYWSDMGKLPVIPLVIPKEQTYAQTLLAAARQVYPTGHLGIVIVEHDIVITSRQWSIIQDTCFENPDSVLAFPYYLHPESTGRGESVIAHRFQDKSGKLHWANEALAPVGTGMVGIRRFGLGCTYVPLNAFSLLASDWDYPSLDSKWSREIAIYSHIPMFMPLMPLVTHLHGTEVLRHD